MIKRNLTRVLPFVFTNKELYLNHTNLNSKTPTRHFPKTCPAPESITRFPSFDPKSNSEGDSRFPFPNPNWFHFNLNRRRFPSQIIQTPLVSVQIRRRDSRNPRIASGFQRREIVARSPLELERLHQTRISLRDSRNR